MEERLDVLRRLVRERGRVSLSPGTNRCVQSLQVLVAMATLSPQPGHSFIGMAKKRGQGDTRRERTGSGVRLI